jgi:hypothetical protein
MAREIHVSAPQDAIEVGGCNGCTEYFDKHGTNKGSQVFDVRLRGMTFRLCPDCARLLRRLLRDELEAA